MENIDYFTPLIGKRYGSPEFHEAMSKFAEMIEKPVSHKLLDNQSPEILDPKNPLKLLYNAEQILVMFSGDQVIATYRACAPYEDKTHKYRQGEIPYISPRYEVSPPHDLSLTSYLLYYLSITAHRYLNIIKSFYETPPGAELNYDRSKLVLGASSTIKRALKLQDTFKINGTESEELQKQKVGCHHHSGILLDKLSNIILRRAEPFTTTNIDAVIAKGLKPSTDKMNIRIANNTPILGPNDEMELSIRYMILALKLIAHDFNKHNGIEVNAEEVAEDKKEFALMFEYFMLHAEFQPVKSDGKIIEPTEGQLKEFSSVLKEVHGETGKIGTVLSIVENAKRSQVEAYLIRKVHGYEMLNNRVLKISRCAYYMDWSNRTICTLIPARDELKHLFQEFTDLAKLKIYTSVGAKEYETIKTIYTAKASQVETAILGGQYSLSSEQTAAAMEFKFVINAMTETKRRIEGSIEKIRDAVKLRSDGQEVS